MASELARLLADGRDGPHVGCVISYVFIDGFTRVARDEAIDRLKHAIADADGVIVDFAFFGTDAIRLSVEVDAGALTTFRQGLETAEVELFDRCRVDLDHASRMNPTHPISAMLHVSFLSAESELGRSAEQPTSV